MAKLSENGRAISKFTMLGHSSVHWFETSIPIFLVVWLVEFPDVGVAVFGLVVALGYVPFGLGALPAGILTDRYGSKRMILLCLAGMSLSFLLLSVAVSIGMIAIALLMWGTAASIYHPAGLSLISTGVKERGTAFAYHGIAGNVGIASGPLVTATLLIFFEWQVVAAVLALPGMVGLWFGLRAEFNPVAAVEAENIADSSNSASLRELFLTSKTLFASAFIIVFAIVTAEGLFYRGILTYLPEILHGLPTIEAIELPARLERIETADYIYAGLLIVGMAGQYTGGKLTRSFDPERGLAIIFFILTGLTLLFVPISLIGFGAVILFTVVLGFFLFAIQPFYQEAVAVYTPEDARGISYGYTYLGEFGLGAGSIVVGGLLLDRFSMTIFFVVMAAFAFTGGVLSIGLLISNKLDTYN